MLEVFKKGYQLLFKSLEVWLIYLGISIVGLVVNLFPISLLQGLLALTTGFISAGYLFTSPLYFKYKQEHPHLTWNYLVKTLTQNLKRLIVPFLLLGIIFAVIFIVVMIIIIVAHGGKFPAIPNILTVFNLRYSSSAVSASLLMAAVDGLLTFAGIYFAVEQHGFFRSIIESFKLSLKHWRFLLSVIIIFFIVALISGALGPADRSTLLSLNWKIKLFVITALSHLITMGVAATSLVYFQGLKK